MISKKALRARLLDICNGAGWVWNGEGYFMPQSSELDAVGEAIQAIERAFNLPTERGKLHRLRLPFRLKDFNDIDTMTDLVYEAIEYDLGSSE